MKAVCLVKHLITLLVLFASLNAVSPVRAQSLTSTASLSGTVSDPSGARVTNATVRVGNPEKGIARQYKTDSAGQFSYSLLPAGTYTLTAEAPGFTTTKQQGIVLRVGDSVTTNVALTIGTSEQVTVTAAAPLLQTESANVSTEVSTKQIQELPLNLRNVTGLVLLNSSVNNQTQQQLLAAGGAEDTADQDESFLSFGGGFFGTTAFMLDGGWNVSMGWGGVIYVPSAEDVQEFKIQTNSFSSQYGWSTGNVVNVITRSGTNTFHFVLMISFATRHWTPIRTSTIGMVSRRPRTIASSSGQPEADRFTSPAFINSAIRPSSSPITRACGLTIPASTVKSCLRLHLNREIFRPSSAARSAPTHWAGPSTRGRSITLTPPDKSSLRVGRALDQQ